MTELFGWRIRLSILALLVIVLLSLERTVHIHEYFTRDKLRKLVTDAGYWGPPVYTGLFCTGELLHVPGAVFIIIAVLAYGEWWGGMLAIVSAWISVSFAFGVTRFCFGTALAEIESPFVKHLVHRLKEFPVRTVITLRLFTFLAPSVNYFLAVTPIRFYEFFVGSAIGLTPPLLVFIFFVHWFMEQDMDIIAHRVVPIVFVLIGGSLLTYWVLVRQGFVSIDDDAPPDAEHSTGPEKNTTQNTDIGEMSSLLPARRRSPDVLETSAAA